ncbi:NAD(P)-dependent alcohol dehydrogenase [soil metagenome]
MRAIVQHRYGPLRDVLRLQESEVPTPKDGEVVVRVGAASIHIGDCHIIRGVPYLFRPMYGLRSPKAPIPGTDLAGTVEAVGSSVTQLKAGDEVFGWGTGAFAEYARAAAEDLLPKPAGLTFGEASAVGVSAMTALQALRDHGKVKPGQKVLINGASGGVGTFALQIAKSFGAEVTGVCSTRNVDLVSSIGADHVIDYTQEDFTRGGPRYDLILDNVGNHSMSASRRALTPDGTLISNGAPVGGWVGGVGHVLRAMVSSTLVRQQARPFISTNDRADLMSLKELIEAGRIRPVVGTTYPLGDVAEAIAHVAGGHAQGTTVITVPA